MKRKIHHKDENPNKKSKVQINKRMLPKKRQTKKTKFLKQVKSESSITKQGQVQTTEEDLIKFLADEQRDKSTTFSETKFNLEELQKFCLSATEYHDMEIYLQSPPGLPRYPADLKRKRMAKITKQVFKAGTRKLAELLEEQRHYYTQQASLVINWRQTGALSHCNQ